MGLGFSVASNDDMRGEQIEHTRCTVTDKPTTQRSRGQAQARYNYYIDTTCGKFSIDKETYPDIQIDHIYDFTTTKGNWANQPTIVSFAEKR